MRAKETQSSLGASAGEVLAPFNLSADTIARLELHAALLNKWQKTINLVASSTLNDVWSRHFLDSVQVSAALPQARRWVDLGSGAGFPGLVTAILLRDISGACVHLIESDQRKCAFLQHVSRETEAPVVIHAARAESVLSSWNEPVDAVSARGLAPLTHLVLLSQKLLDKGAIGVFPQGKTALPELTDSSLENRFNVETQESTTSVGSWLAIVRAKPMI
jgi:16S rRNA (guanine527-N7)-methyltransferase